MYASRSTQFIVGIFGIIGIAALSVLAFTLGRIPLLSPPHYFINAMFDNVAGLKVNDAVQIAGVKVGKVTTIALSQKTERVRVTMQIHDGIMVDDEAIASIKTNGILGDKYVTLSIGGGEPLKEGGTITHTESSFVLEDVIGQFLGGTGKSPEGGGNPSAASSPAAAGTKNAADSISGPPGLDDKGKSSNTEKK